MNKVAITRITASMLATAVLVTAAALAFSPQSSATPTSGGATPIGALWSSPAARNTRCDVGVGPAHVVRLECQVIGSLAPTPTPPPAANEAPRVAPTPTPTLTPTSPATPTPPLPTTLQPSPSADANSFVVVVPIYNNQGLEVVRTGLRPYIRPGDIFLLVSGNNNRWIDVTWLNTTAATLKDLYPNTVIMAGTSGLANVSSAASGVRAPIEAVAYVYEPNFPNEPEFTWDFSVTSANFDQATQLVHSRGLLSVGKPTGRPILQAALQKHNWNYGILGQRVDQMIIQTQTYCKKSPQAFEAAIDKVLSQYQEAGATGRWFPLVSVDPRAPNGVPIQRALDCANAIKGRGLTGFLMWWSPRHADVAIQLLQSLGR